MVTDRNKIIALAALGTLWVGLFAWNWLIAEAPARVPLANVSGPTTASSPVRTIAAVGGHVQLDLLEASRTQREMSFTAPRNIFAAPRPDNRGIPIGGQDGDPNAQSAMRRGAVAAELAQFHYLGFVRMEEGSPKKGTLAVLTKNDDLHVVKAGDMLEDRVIVKTIGQDSVTLQDRDSRVEHTLLLSEEPVSDSALTPGAP